MKRLCPHGAEMAELYVSVFFSLFIECAVATVGPVFKYKRCAGQFYNPGCLYVTVIDKCNDI